MIDMVTVATDMTVQRVAIDDWLDQLDAQDEEEEAKATKPIDDPFLEFELVIATALATRGEDFVADAEEIIKKAFYIPIAQKAAGDKTREYTARIEEAISAVEQTRKLWETMGLTLEAENTISYALGDALTAGTKTAYEMTGSMMPLSNIARSSMVDGMMKASKYYSNAFFNAQVMPALIRAIELGAGTEGENLIWSTIRDVLHTRLKTVPYWRVVANAAASRAYHYGVLKSGQSAGKRFYEFSAILDAKTSETCWALDGRQWPVADAVALMERIANAEPEEVKVLAPWLRYKDIQPLLSNPYAMQALGVIIPPVHGNCRSSIILR